MSKILFIRHSESIDDLTNQYGGWADLDLSPHGRQQYAEVIPKVRDLNEYFSVILHSPLKRAKESAYILGSGLGVEVRESVWLKEKNGYGLLTGLTKEEAKSNYPELVENMDNGYIYGSEPEDLFVARVKKAYQILSSMDVNLIAVTHGGFLSRLFEHVLSKKYIKAHDAGFILLDTETLEISHSDSFDFDNK